MIIIFGDFHPLQQKWPFVLKTNVTINFVPITAFSSIISKIFLDYNMGPSSRQPLWLSGRVMENKLTKNQNFPGTLPSLAGQPFLTLTPVRDRARF
jgi:hypothetical protein